MHNDRKQKIEIINSLYGDRSFTQYGLAKKLGMQKKHVEYVLKESNYSYGVQVTVDNNPKGRFINPVIDLNKMWCLDNYTF